MKSIGLSTTAILGGLLVSACTTIVPSEMKLTDPSNRRMVERPGMNLDAIRLACAETMLNASPATEASHIVVRVVSAENPVVTEVDAVLKNVGMFKQDLPVTYRCEYTNGSLTKGVWMKGLKGE